MYNGIGLRTPRGSGTNGYIQRNLAYIPQERAEYVIGHRNEKKSNINEKLKKKPSKLRVDQSILEHQQKRAIEVEVFKEQCRLEESGLDSTLIETKLNNFRQRLIEDYNRNGQLKSNNNNNPLSSSNMNDNDSHQQNAEKLRKNAIMRNALQLEENTKGEIIDLNKVKKEEFQKNFESTHNAIEIMKRKLDNKIRHPLDHGRLNSKDSKSNNNSSNVNDFETEEENDENNNNKDEEEEANEENNNKKHKKSKPKSKKHKSRKNKHHESESNSSSTTDEEDENNDNDNTSSTSESDESSSLSEMSSNTNTSSPSSKQPKKYKSKSKSPQNRLEILHQNPFRLNRTMPKSKSKSRSRSRDRKRNLRKDNDENQNKDIDQNNEQNHKNDRWDDGQYEEKKDYYGRYKKRTR